MESHEAGRMGSIAECVKVCVYAGAGVAPWPPGLDL
jgi:hypothetical protein